RRASGTPGTAAARSASGPSGRTEPTRSTGTVRTAPGSTKAAGRAEAAAPVAPARGLVGRHPGGEGDQLLPGDHAVMVRIRLVEQPEQPRVGDLLAGEPAVLVLVERH